MNTDKKIAFEYLIFKLIEWFKSCQGLENDTEFNSHNDFNKLKVIKLHFFVVAINSNSNNLLELFDQFYAMPYGHVESDIYNGIDDLDRYEIGVSNLIIKNAYVDNLEQSFSELPIKTKTEIDESIELLKKEDNCFITHSALELVEISHTWYSWKNVFSLARSRNKYSAPIPPEIIKKENKFFTFTLQ